MAVIEPLPAFLERWTGELILITSRASLAGELARFDFSWFIPSLVKYRGLFGEVLVVSLFLQLFALVSPLFLQVVMDKVLVHRGLTTLDVLVIGLAVVVLFESVLTVLRTYRFGRGSGVDTIGSYEMNATKVDVLQLGPGIAPSDIQLTKSNNDLYVSIRGTSDFVRVLSQFLNNSKSGYQIDQIRFEDGTMWNVADIQSRVNGYSAVASPSVRLASKASWDTFLESSDPSGAWTGQSFADLPTESTSVLIDTQAQRLVDAMAAFTLSDGASSFLSSGHHITVMPVLAPQFAP